MFICLKFIKCTFLTKSVIQIGFALKMASIVLKLCKLKKDSLCISCLHNIISQFISVICKNSLINQIFTYKKIKWSVQQIFYKYSTMQKADKKLEQVVQKGILFQNKELNSSIVKGYDFNKGVNYDELFKSFATTGLQATNLSSAIDIINQMISWRLSDQPLNQQDDEETSDPQYRKNVRCKIFLGYTSNMVSSGVREIIKYLAQHKMIDCIVTSTGGIEQDFMKVLGNFNMGDFQMDDRQNRLNGHCRIGNILVANENYIKLENFLLPIFAQMYKQQQDPKLKTLWTPSKLIHRLGKQINHPDSVYYWCYKNDIPVFCPAITDGAIGDMLFTNSWKNDLVIDVIQDIKEISKMAMRAPKSGVIILGGSVPKHHILNAHIWRNGADYGVFVNTGIHQDGSDSGAKISEAYTWGKLRLDAKYSKIYGQASFIFPLIVAQTFAKRQQQATKIAKKQTKEI